MGFRPEWVIKLIRQGRYDWGLPEKEILRDLISVAGYVQNKLYWIEHERKTRKDT